MVEPYEYPIRGAREARERQFAQERERRGEVLAVARRKRDQVYEANKHISTLFATAVGLVVALSRLGIADVDLALGLFAFGVPLIEALSGMLVSIVVPEKLEEDQRDLATPVAGMSFVLASFQFSLGALLLLPSATGTLGY